MKGGNTYDEKINPVIVAAVKEYVKTHTLTGRELVVDVPGNILPEISLYDKREAICQMRLQRIIKFDGFRCSV